MGASKWSTCDDGGQEALPPRLTESPAPSKSVNLRKRNDNNARNKLARQGHLEKSYGHSYFPVWSR